MFRPSLILLFAILLAATLCRGANGDAPSGSLTLRAALARTLEQNPELTAFSWDIRAAEARMLQASLRPNPELSVEAENVTGTGELQGGREAERTLRLSQVVELGDKRATRVAESTAGREVAEWEYQLKRVEVLKATTQAFIEALAAQRQVELAEQSATLAETVTPVTERRVEVGKASAVEVTRSQVAVATARIELEQARRTLATARGNLAAQWGARTASFSSVTGELDRVEELPTLANLSARAMRNPQLARWSAEREKRQAAVASARAQGRPDVTVQIGPRVLGNADDATFVAGVSLPLPLWNRNQGTVAEMQANVRKVDAEQRAAEARLFAELNAAYQTLARAAHEVEILRREVLPGAQRAEEELITGYETGRFTQLEILDARRTLISARNQHLRALADYHKALAEIDALTAAPVDLHRHASVSTATPVSKSRPQSKAVRSR